MPYYNIIDTSRSFNELKTVVKRNEHYQYDSAVPQPSGDCIGEINTGILEGRLLQPVVQVEFADSGVNSGLGIQQLFDPFGNVID